MTNPLVSVDPALLYPNINTITSIGIQNARQEQTKPKELILHMKFALLQINPNSGQAEGDSIYNGAGFPLLVEDATSINSLGLLQERQLWMTYHYHGLSVRDIAAYELLLPTQGGLKSLGLYHDDAQWGQLITALRTVCEHTCNPDAQCVLCTHPPVVMVYFHRQVWEYALRKNKRRHSYTSLTLLDPYCESYANMLRDANESAFQQYINTIRSVSLELSQRDLSGMRVPIPGIDTNIDESVTTSAEPSTPIYTSQDEAPKGTKRSASTTSTTELPSKKTRRLVVPNARAVKTKTATDFESVSVKPIGNTKLETDKCFTCVHLNRSCSGTTIIDGRCEMCAAKSKSGGSRKCYWRTLSIDTYEAAKAADSTAVYNNKNTRAGRIQRAHDRWT